MAEIWLEMVVKQQFVSLLFFVTPSTLLPPTILLSSLCTSVHHYTTSKLEAENLERIKYVPSKTWDTLGQTFATLLQARRFH